MLELLSVALRGQHLVRPEFLDRFHLQAALDFLLEGRPVAVGNDPVLPLVEDSGVELEKLDEEQLGFQLDFGSVCDLGVILEDLGDDLGLGVGQ